MTTHDGRYQDYAQQRVFGSLDGVRAFSVIAVVWHHTDIHGGPSWLHLGFLGVDMFFVLSGFLIVTLLLREKARKGRISLKSFYIRRSLRIFPVYYGLLFVLSVAHLFLAQAATRSTWFAELPILVTYTANIWETTLIMAIAWSLAAEEQFYLVWPTIERLPRWLTLSILAAAMLVSQAIHFRLFTAAGIGFEDRLPSMLLETTFTPILLGVLLAHALDDPRTFGLLSRAFGARFTSPLLVLVLVGVFLVVPDDVTGWPRLTIHIVMVSLLAACVVREDHGLAPVLRIPFLVRIGAVSYGIYLFHMLARHAVRIVLEKLSSFEVYGLFFIGTLLATWLVAELSFRFYELPFLNLKKRFQQI